MRWNEIKKIKKKKQKSKSVHLLNSHIIGKQDKKRISELKSENKKTVYQKALEHFYDKTV